jgi:hypothetical protein
MSSIPAALQQQVAERSRYCCGYCQSQQRLMGISLTIDHIVPQTLGGQTELDNMCLACWDCNLIKGDRTTAVEPVTGKSIRLFHPNQQRWLDHFNWSKDGLHIIGITPIGQATVIALKLNRPQLVEARRYWTVTGRHPPDPAQ